MSADARGEARWHADAIFLLAATVVLLVARIPVMGVRFFDQDELEHAHAAWSVFNGLVPYRDFFEHHTPWYYYALAPFFRAFAVDQSYESAHAFLVFARGVSLALTALSAGLVFLVGRIGTSRKVGLLAALFLVGQPVVIQKTLEIRPDVPALSFFIAGLWLLLRALRAHEEAPPRGLRWFLAGGLCFGASIMCTQKALFILPGAFAGLALWAWAGRGQTLRARIIALLVVAVGVALPVAMTWAWFAVHGGAAPFVFNNFILNARWKAHSSRNVLTVLATSWPILALGVVGAAVAIHNFRRAAARQYGDVVLLCTLGGLIAGLVVVPAAYRQYHLMPLAIACVFAARGLSFLVELAQERARAWVLVAATVPLLILPAVELARSLGRVDGRQLARLRYVFEHTGPADTVLDGWLGTGVFRPHPLYYFFMHGELRVMLTDQEKDTYLDALESGRVRPSLITVDQELLALGPRFLRFLNSNYVSSDGRFYFPTAR